MHLILTLSICYEFRTKLRNVEGIITYSLGEDYCPYDFWEDSAEDTEETNSSDKTENCTEEIEYEDPAPDFGEYDIHRPLTHLNPEKGTRFYFHYDFGDDWYLLFMFQSRKDKSLKCIKSVGTVKQYGYDAEDFDDSFYEDDEE